LIIEGQRGNGFRGDIALDDVRIETGACGIPTENEACGFESGMCGFTQVN